MMTKADVLHALENVSDDTELLVTVRSPETTVGKLAVLVLIESTTKPGAIDMQVLTLLSGNTSDIFWGNPLPPWALDCQNG